MSLLIVGALLFSMQFTCAADECEHVLVADDGHVVTYGALRCAKDAEPLTIRDADGSVVRTLRVRDVMTANDQQWLCRGGADELRFDAAGVVHRGTAWYSVVQNDSFFAGNGRTMPEMLR